MANFVIDDKCFFWYRNGQALPMFVHIKSQMNVKKSKQCQELPVWSKSRINNVVIIKILHNCCTESVLVLIRIRKEKGKRKLQRSVQDMLKMVEEVSRKR